MQEITLERCATLPSTLVSCSTTRERLGIEQLLIGLEGGGELLGYSRRRARRWGRKC